MMNYTIQRSVQNWIQKLLPSNKKKTEKKFALTSCNGFATIFSDKLHSCAWKFTIIAGSIFMGCLSVPKSKSSVQENIIWICGKGESKNSKVFEKYDKLQHCFQQWKGSYEGMTGYGRGVCWRWLKSEDVCR